MRIVKTDVRSWILSVTSGKQYLATPATFIIKVKQIFQNKILFFIKLTREMQNFDEMIEQWDKGGCKNSTYNGIFIYEYETYQMNDKVRCEGLIDISEDS